MTLTRLAAAAVVVIAFASSALAQSTRTVTASWDPNTDAGTTGYLLSYGTAPGSYQWSVDAGNQSSRQITLSTGALYYFSVQAYNSSAQLSAPSNEATIDLRAQAPTAQITATMQSATTALVSWSTTNAVSAAVNGVAVALSGSQTVTLSGTTVFTIVATGASGATATSSATATVVPVTPIAQITATTQGTNTAVVTWSTANAVSATINGVAVALSGTQSVTISTTTTFTLVATSVTGTTLTRSATATVGTTPPPTASITATMQGTATALVTWATGNAVRAEINGNSVALSGSLSVPVTATTTYRLVATAASGATAEASATVTPPTSGETPSAPTGLSSAVAGSRVTLSWRAPSSGPAPTRYLLDVGTQPGSSDLVSGYVVMGLSASGEAPKGRYYARVRAANAAGTSPTSNESPFKIGRTLRTPTGFGVQWQGVVATISWDAAASDGAVEDRPTAYVLEAGTGPGKADVATVQLGNVTSFSAPIPAGAYYVRVRAVNDFGDSDPTADLRLAAPGVPTAPTGLVAFNSPALVELRWNAPAGSSVSGYVLEAGSGPGLADLVVAPVGNVTRFTAPAPPPGVYYVRVRAVNGVGQSQASNEIVVRR